MKVVLIIGATRSGSTLLDLVLGHLKGAVSIGELRFIWRRGVIEEQLCGCGTPLRKCDFWSRVFREDDLSDIYAAALRRERLLDRVDRIRHIPLLWMARRLRWSSKRIASYVDQEWRFLEAISRAAGCDIVIDSSKYPGRALALSAGRSEARELYVIHLVRDARAVAYAWTMKKIRPEITTETSFMPTYPVAYSAVAWAGINLAAETLRAAVDRKRYFRLRYEDFAQDPESTIPKLKEFVGLPPSLANAPKNTSGGAEIAHTVSGNPIRFGPVTDVCLDEKWKDNMSRYRRILVALLSFPLLMRYGYLSGDRNRSDK